MPWALALILLMQAAPGGSEQPEPASFEVRILADPDKREERSYVVGGTSFHLSIRALDKDGKVLARFTGPVKITGLNVLHKDRKPVRLGTSGPFADGEAALRDVRLGAPVVTISHGSATAEWEPRIIPGWLSIVPPLLAIVLAIVTRQVLIALLAGTWIGVCVVLGFTTEPLLAPFAALLRVFDTHVVQSLAGNVEIVIFSLALGGMVGVIGRSGGSKALVTAISGVARTRRSGMFATWLMGMAIFFDDYANCLLVGNTVRPFTDKRKISREKLSFIIDATSAPVAGLMVISTWIGYELLMLTASGVIDPADAYGTFVDTIPYRFYNILMLLFVLGIALSGRDFGPMLRAEQRAVATGKVLRDGAKPLVDNELTEMEPPPGRPLRLSNALVPIAATIIIVAAGLYIDGALAVDAKLDDISASVEAGTLTEADAAAKREDLSGFRAVIGEADAFAVLIWSSFGGSILALLMALWTRALKLSEAMEAWVAGCKSMIAAVLILVLAWSLGDVCRNLLLTGPWLISLVEPPASWMPFIVFLVSCLIAFATGTSYGTMAIVFPIAGPMVWIATGDASGVSPELALPIRLATLSSVLSGAVFGDHCSPISDTTILSSMGAAADHIDHVRTQMPYAVVCAAVAAAAGYIPAGFGLNPYVGLALGTAILAAVIYLAGRRAEAPPN